MKREIPKTNDYTDISVLDLPYRQLYDDEFRQVKRFVNKMNLGAVLCSCMCFLTALLFLLITLYNIHLNRLKNEKEIFIFCFFFALIGFLILKGKLPKPSRIMKTQYGQVNGTWSLRTGQKKTRNYYMDVIFPNTKTRYRKVQCLHKDYMKAEKGDKILVIAFHDKKVCGLIIRDEL